MNRPDNPRFPHTCRIIRYAETEPMDDQPLFDPMQDEDPMADEESVESQGSGENADKTEGAEIVIYEGECRAYDKHTTSDKGEIITSYRGLALPVTRDGWQEWGSVPLAGDRVVVNRGSHEEYGSVIDSNPGNFGGTHLIWKYGRN